MMTVQVIIATATALSCLLLKTMAAPRYGVEGVVWASVIPMIGIGIGPAMWVVWLKLARLERRINAARTTASEG